MPLDLLIALSLPIPQSIPSPSDGVWNLGPVPLRGYALCIIAGIVAAIWIGERRWIARGGQAGDVQDLAIWAVPFGLVGARLYHVATDSGRYFDGDGSGAPIEALYIWKGGLGIWGAVALGALGVYIGARRKNIKMLPMIDALAPGVLVAQALGRWGNWFNQELYGRPTDLPWGLEIDPRFYPEGQIFDVGTLFHPTFLYECLWNLAAFAVLIWADRRFRLGHGQVFALYVVAYTAGRGWIEHLRIDSVELDDVGGLRFNVWTSIVLFLAALAFFLWSRKRWPDRETSVYRDASGAPSRAADEDGESGADEASDTDVVDEASDDSDEEELSPLAKARADLRAKRDAARSRADEASGPATTTEVSDDADAGESTPDRDS